MYPVINLNAAIRFAIRAMSVFQSQGVCAIGKQG